MRLRTSLVLALVCGLVLAFSTSAFAESPAGDVYGGVGASQEIQATSPEGNDATTSQAVESTGSLPFTGLDVGLVAIVGIGLGGVGLVIRRSLASRTD